MADDTKSKNAQVREKNENPEATRKLQQENPIREERKVGSWLFRVVAPLVAGFAISGCDNSVTDDTDSDAGIDAQEDAEVDSGEDEAGPDVEEAEADVGEEDAPAEAEGEAEADADAEGEVEDAPGEEACDISITTETENLAGPGRICESEQDITKVWEVTSDCTGETGRRLLSHEVSVSPPLNTEGSQCARGNMVGALNGDEAIIELFGEMLASAATIADGVKVAGETLAGGAGEYSARVESVSADSIRLTVFDPAGTEVGTIFLSSSDYQPAPGSTEKGYFARTDPSGTSVHLYYIRLPIADRMDRTVERSESEDANFIFRPNMLGMDYNGARWSRE